MTAPNDAASNAGKAGTNRKRLLDTAGLCLIIGGAFAILYFIAWLLSAAARALETILDHALRRYGPGLFHDFAFWLADDVLPPMAPAVKWLQDVGNAWNGLLTVGGFLLAVLGILISLAASGDGTGKKGG